MFTFNHRIAYDYDLANLHFNDFKDGHTSSTVNLFFGSRETDYVVIFENEKVANTSYYKKSKLARMNKEELHGLNYYYDLIMWRNTELLKSELIENLLTVTNEYHYSIHYEKEDYQNLDYDFAVRGYGQGDYCKVKIVGNVDKWINKDYLTNIFYDTPISGIIEVFKNGSLIDEFNLNDLSNFNEYDYYDKDKLIDMIADYCSNEDYKDLLVTYLNDNLNTTIGYDY